MDEYRVIEISVSQLGDSEEINGILEKGWVEDTPVGRALFKEASVDNDKLAESRTDWSEKVTSELSKLISLPVAEYEFADLIEQNKRTPGVLSLDLEQSEDSNRYTLEELLKSQFPDYEYPQDYTVENVAIAMAKKEVKLPPHYRVPEGISDGVDMFVGVLMLDALIANTDRHDLNLEIVEREDGTLYLSPVFDHGFSLGAVMEQPADRKWMSGASYDKHHNLALLQDRFHIQSNKQAFAKGIELRPKAGEIWLEQLSKVKEKDIEQVFNRLNSDRITPEASQFAQKIINHTKKQLLNLQQEKLPEEELRNRYQDYSEDFVTNNLSEVKTIAIRAIKEGMDREKIHLMLQQNDLNYRELIDSGGEKLARKTIILKAAIESALDSEKKDLLDLEASKSLRMSR